MSTVGGNSPMRAMHLAHRRCDRGYSLLEVMIASLITALVGMGLTTMLFKTQEFTADTSSVLEAQQGARMALDKMQRELMNAGIGLQDLVAPFAPIEQRSDGGIKIRWNPTGRVEPLKDTLQSGQIAIRLIDTRGFSPEQYVLVTDSVGNAEMFQLRSVEANSLMTYESSSSDFLVSDGASVSSLAQAQYWVDDSTGTTTLWRQLDGQAPQPVAIPVRSLALTYLDDSTPPIRFVPTTVPERMRIRAVEVTLIVDAPRPRLRDGTVQSATLRTRTVPRAILLTH